MITPSFSPTATERVLPNLALDFTTASLDSRVTFTRTTSASNPATYVANTGYITAATNNQPRFDYNPVTLVCKGLLIEESRTNTYTYSEDFSQTIWNKINSSVNTFSVTNPVGGSTTYKLIENTSNNTHYINYPLSTTSGTTYTQSFYVKAAERTKMALFLGANGWGTAINVLFDLTAVTATVQTGTATATIADAGNGWYRVTVTATASVTGASSNTQIRICDDSGNTTYTGDGVKGIYIDCAQFEAGSFSTSYIPTTSATLTRNADVATMTGTNFSSWWTATTGAANVSIIPKSISDIKPLFQMDDNSADNIISLRGNATNPELYIKATTDQAQIDAGIIVANTTYTLAGTWNTDNCAAAQNGATAVTDTSATIPTVTQARIGFDGINYANAWLQKISYWPQRITDNEVQAFSK